MAVRIDMSHVRCPLCGRDCAVSIFDPSKLDRDIYIRQVRRATKGFAYGPDESVLGDDVFTPMIKCRCLDLIRLFMENDIISSSEVSRELKIGVPIVGSEDVVPFEKVLNIREQIHSGKIAELKNQVSQLSSNTDSNAKYTELNRAYEELNNSLELKKRINKVLSWLFTRLDSEIIIFDDDWALKVKIFDLEVLPEFCEKIYEMQRDERGLLQDRIIYEGNIVTLIFDFFIDEPVMVSMTDEWRKKPNLVYYLANGLPAPEYCKVDAIQEYLGWETIWKSLPVYLLYFILSGKPRLAKYGWDLK